jgi:serine/threonine protein kinase
MSGSDRRGEELIGKTLGSYEVEYRLGAGATGVVFRAKDVNTGAIVALKVLNENLGTISSLRRRFEREARVLTKLEHPNIVHIQGFGVQDTYTFIAMELLEGTTLEDVLDQAPLEPQRALEVMTEMLRGLAFAHDKGVVHRDLKPANVFLCRAPRPDTEESAAAAPAATPEAPTREAAVRPAATPVPGLAIPGETERSSKEPRDPKAGETDRASKEPREPKAREREHVKLLDFGLAKLLSDEPGAEGEDGTLTRKGRIVGTPAYMAPEQITGVSLDVRADVYAAGILLYELLADRRPFLSDRRSELLRAHLLSPPPPLETSRPGLKVHPELEGLVKKALEKNPNDRFPDAQAMLEAMLALPRRPARMASTEASPTRSRSGATSEVISSSERRAVSESISGSEPDKSSPRTTPLVIPGASPPAGMIASGPSGGTASLPDASAPGRTLPRASARSEPTDRTKRPSSSERDRSTGAYPASSESNDKSGLSTPMLYVLAVLLFAVAAALWFTVGPGFSS